MMQETKLTSLLLVAGLATGCFFNARAESITFVLVTESKGQTTQIPDRQELWQSPFGGYWVARTVPFRLLVGDQTIFDWSNKRDKMLDQAEKTVVDSDSKLIEKMMAKVDTVLTQREDSCVNGLYRKTSTRVVLPIGKYTIRPLGIEFTIKDDGTPVSQDPRIRIVAKERRIELVCYPVSFRMFAEGATAPMPMQLAMDTGVLTEGIDTLVAEAGGRNPTDTSPLPPGQFYKLTLYLPATLPEKPYNMNTVRFLLGADGQVKLQPGSETVAKCGDGHEIRFLKKVPTAPAAASNQRLVGVRWAGAERGVNINGAIVSKDAEGSGCLTFAGAAAQGVRIGSLDVPIPAVDAAWPHQALIWDGKTETAWLVALPAMTFRPGAEIRCRATRLAGKAVESPKTITVALEPMSGGASGGSLSLKAGDGGVYAGALPSKAGFWRLRVAGDSSGPLQGQILGVALVCEQPTAAVSLFTFKNRALQRRGDAIDLLWFARRNAGAAAAEWPVRLRGMGLDAIVARIAVPAGSGSSADASGRLAVDTSALAAGEYTAVVEADGVAGYPFRFRICQRERLSDFDIYSYAPHTTAAEFYPGSPINSYVGPSPGGPGLEPFMAVGDGAYDGAMAAYANAPFGPAREMFARPGAGELALMAMASQGVHVAPTFPESHADEQRNPKHTLPENLANLRRRMALYIQSQADYPGIGGFDFGWLSSYGGYWEYTPRLDGWQSKAAGEAGAWAWKRTKEEWPKVVAKYAHLKPINKTLSDKWNKELADIPGLTEAQMGYVNQTSPLLGWWDRILPNSLDEWFADVKEIRPGMTTHDHKSSPSLNGPFSWFGKSHRSSVDFSEHFISPMDCFRSPAVMAMDNRNKQKIQIAVQTHPRMLAEVVPMVLGAAGRGADGIAFSGLNAADAAGGDALPRVLERFGSWFTTLDPLPDVAVYYSPHSWGARIFTVLYDLARLRRPGMMVGPQDVEAGELLKYKVLLLIGQEMNMPPEILDGFRAFEAQGGVILKDDTCAKDVPGRSIGFAYDNSRVAGSWGGAQAGGEGEHVWALSQYLAKEKLLVDAFAKTPQPVVTTPDTDILISPLAGKESIICLTIDKTEVPLAETGDRWRQQTVLPKVGELQVEKGWYVHDLLAGKAAKVESTPKGVRVPVEFCRGIGAIYLLTKREPKSLSIQAERTTPINARLTGGLADADGKLLADPMPFEVTLKGPDGATLFHKFASIGPEQPFDVPVPAMSAGAQPELVVRDLVLGTTATQALEPAAAACAAVRPALDLIGGEKKILAFLSQRKGPVTILLDEGQGEYRRAADQMAALLKKSGREARVVTWDLLDVRPLPLRWVPWPEEVEIVDSLRDGKGFAWRINKNPWAAFVKDKTGKIIKSDYSLPDAGYAESGPHLRYDADVVLFGTPANHRALADLAPYLRRVPTENYPASGNFFIHYVWSPFRAGYDALYMGSRDVAGAEAAVASLAVLTPPAPAPVVKSEVKPVVLRSAAPTTLEDVSGAMGSTPIIKAEFSPSGNRLFVITASYGDWLFVLDPDGKLLEQRMPPNSKWFPYWFLWGRWMNVQSDTLLRLFLFDGEYQYDLTRGYLSKSARMSMLEDKKAGRFFRGDGERVYAMDAQGRLLWCYNDSVSSGDLTVVRSVTPRVLNGNGRVLLVSATAGKESGSVLGLDCATGKILWQRDGVVLNSGKVITLDDRFIVIADDGAVTEIIAADGRAGNAMSALTGSPDFVLQVPGRDSLLIAENSHFNRQGPSCRVYLRSLKNGAEQDLKVPGRVFNIVFLPDNQSFVVVTSARRALRFACDGALIWDVKMPSNGSMLASPDGKTLALSGSDGMVHLFHTADGKLKRSVDLNFANNITAEKFIKQERMGDLPTEVGRALPAMPLEPSYLKSIVPPKVTFGPNLAPPEQLRELLKPADPVASEGEKPGYLGKLTEAIKLPPFKVEAGTTYLVELLDVVGVATNTESMLRLEITVTGNAKAKNLPCTARLPVDSILARRRFAFRADNNDEVTVTIRPIMPLTVSDNRGTRRTFDKVVISEIPVVIGDVVVSAMKFPGPNVLLDGGPGSRSKPAGSFTCKLYPIRGEAGFVYPTINCQTFALQLVNGVIANRPTSWGKINGRIEDGGTSVASADAVTRFSNPTTLSAVAVYEDMTGPLIEGNVRERTAIRYAVEVHNATGNWERIGVLTDNRQLVNIFPCPAYKIDGIRYVWAGRYDDLDRKRTDGYVRTAQIEAYAADDARTIGEMLNITKEPDGMNLDP